MIEIIFPRALLYNVWSRDQQHQHYLGSVERQDFVTSPD